jgi:UDP-N-acetylglucosamine 4,6-dehydratase
VGKRVLITGGSGFLGRGLAPALKGDHEVFLAARNNKQNMLAHEQTGCAVLPMDVASIESVRDVFVEVRPQIVIHAAATKFVDVAERQPMECVDVNVTGSQNVARVALQEGAAMVIGISTDKAAPPIRNTYGLSKALMERMFCSLDGKSDTRFACVRYGNVAWSTGSVLPIWKGMHDDTGVIGTTGPHMRRFFFTVDEAAALVLTAMREIDSVRGKVLARQMKAALIKDLLEVWTDLRGGEWEQIEGRPGEREDEFLIGDIELPYIREVTYDGIPHYVIAFNEKSDRPPAEALSSANTERLSRDEMVALVEAGAE